VKMLKPLVFWIVLGLLIFVSIRAMFAITYLNVTVASNSPEGRYCVRMIELNGFLDRNFKVSIEDRWQRESFDVYHSPDEGHQIGTEEFVWSNDQ
jgi:hypothetical protein